MKQPFRGRHYWIMTDNKDDREIRKCKTNLSKEQNQTLKDLFDFLSELSINLKNRNMFFSGFICEVFMSRIYNQFLSKVDGSS